jgi:hypothetical protein
MSVACFQFQKQKSQKKKLPLWAEPTAASHRSTRRAILACRGRRVDRDGTCRRGAHPYNSLPSSPVASHSLRLSASEQDAAEDAAGVALGEGWRGRRGSAGRRQGRHALPVAAWTPGRARQRPRGRRGAGAAVGGGGGARARARARRQGADHGEGVPGVPVEPGLAGGAAVTAVLPGGPGQLRAHGAGRAAEDQGGAGPDAGVPAVVPGGHLRVVRDERRRREHGGVPQARGRGRVAAEHGHAAAAHVRGQGPGRGPHRLLPAVQVRRAVAQDQGPAAQGPRAPAVAGAAEEAGRAVRVHPVRVLQHGVPVLLVELGGVPGPRRAAARLPLGLRQPGPLWRAAGAVAVGRLGQDVQVQDDQELHGDVPQEPRPRRGHLGHEGIAPAPKGLTSQETALKHGQRVCSSGNKNVSR